MPSKRTSDRLRWLFALAALLSTTTAALAQSSTKSEQQGQTFVVEPIRSGFVLAPDVKFTELDGDFGNLVGGYGGWLEDEKLFLGAGGYWLTNGSRGTGLGYGGAIVEWFASRSEPVTFSLRALVGGGEGSLPVTVGPYPPPRPPRRMSGMFPQDDSRWYDHSGYGYPATAVAHVGFFVTEPQMNLSFRLGDWLQLGVGAGYRFIGGASGLENRLKGPTASLSLQFRFF
jgi:hypothetical protein